MQTSKLVVARAVVDEIESKQVLLPDAAAFDAMRLLLTEVPVSRRLPPSAPCRYASLAITASSSRWRKAVTRCGGALSKPSRRSHHAGKLVSAHFQFSPRVSATKERIAHVEQCVERMQALRVAIEFCNKIWLAEDRAPQTLA